MLKIKYEPNSYTFYTILKQLRRKKIQDVGNTEMEVSASSLTLFRAMMNGVLRSLRRLMDSIVCGSRPCMISTTRMARSHREDPRDRRLLSTSQEKSNLIKFFIHDKLKYN